MICKAPSALIIWLILLGMAGCQSEIKSVSRYTPDDYILGIPKEDFMIHIIYTMSPRLAEVTESEPGKKIVPYEDTTIQRQRLIKSDYYRKIAYAYLFDCYHYNQQKETHHFLIFEKHELVIAIVYTCILGEFKINNKKEIECVRIYYTYDLQRKYLEEEVEEARGLFEKTLRNEIDSTNKHYENKLICRKSKLVKLYWFFALESPLPVGGEL